MRIAVIPARGGSKRIPRKNIRLFCGMPIIAWSIKAARSSGLFDQVIISTDDSEIAGIARAYGAEVPFMRPASLSDDHTGTSRVVAHAIEWYRERGFEPNAVCCIYATAPFVTAEDLRQGLKALEDNESQFSFTVTSYPFPIQRAIRLTKNGRVEMFQTKHINTRSQDLEPAFHDAGQFYWGRSDAWVGGTAIFGPDASVLQLPRHRVQDIDTLEDWMRAETLFRALTNEGCGTEKLNGDKA